jgi:hypothetical protein
MIFFLEEEKLLPKLWKILGPFKNGSIFLATSAG